MKNISTAKFDNLREALEYALTLDLENLNYFHLITIGGYTVTWS